jgi:hypothetical protein
VFDVEARVSDDPSLRCSAGVRLVFGDVARTDDTIVKNTCESRADARIRTADPFITSEVLYQLSYVGGASNEAGSV